VTAKWLLSSLRTGSLFLSVARLLRDVIFHTGSPHATFLSVNLCTYRSVRVLALFFAHSIFRAPSLPTANCEVSFGSNGLLWLVTFDDVVRSANSVM